VTKPGFYVSEHNGPFLGCARVCNLVFSGEVSALRVVTMMRPR